MQLKDNETRIFYDHLLHVNAHNNLTCLGVPLHVQTPERAKLGVQLESDYGNFGQVGFVDL